MDPALAVFGLLVGALVGLTGVGGGSIMTPLLILVFDVKPVLAVGTDLFYGAVTKTAGGYKHLRQRTVDLRLSWWMAAGSVPAAIAGVLTLELLESSLGGGFDETLLALVAGAVLFAGVAVAARGLLGSRLKGGERESVQLDRRNKLGAAAVGAAVGFILGITSVGSGALVGVALILVFRLTPHRVVGTDVFHAAILLWAAAAAHMVSANIDWGLAGNLLVGSIPGIWVGSHFSARMPGPALRGALAIVLTASGVALSTKAGWGPSLVSFMACALPSVGVSIIVVRRRSRRDATVPDPVSERA